MIEDLCPRGCGYARDSGACAMADHHAPGCRDSMCFDCFDIAEVEPSAFPPVTRDEVIESLRDHIDKLTADLDEAETWRDAEVEVEGYSFKRRLLPEVLANHMRAADTYAREAKATYGRIHELKGEVVKCGEIIEQRDAAIRGLQDDLKTALDALHEARFPHPYYVGDYPPPVRTVTINVPPSMDAQTVARQINEHLREAVRNGH